MAYLLGIDVGTTRTSAAIDRVGDHPEIEVVNLGDRSSAVPSALYVAHDGRVVVGDAAERRALDSPQRVVREFKRRIGDPTPVVVGGRRWAPQELSARLIEWVVDRVTQREGGPPDRVVVTHPASWGVYKKELLGSAMAARQVTATLLPEPHAAAMHYASAERVEAGSTIAVYDFGGGTFDAAVVQKDAFGFGLLGRPEGLERLGGVDLDELVFAHVLQAMPGVLDELDGTDPTVQSALLTLRRECTEAKEALSSDTVVTIPVLLPGTRGSVRLHRREFESMIRLQVEDTVAALRRAVESAGLTPERLTAVLLVGGSSRIPLVAQLVSEHLGRPVAVDADPKNAIAQGAAQSVRPTRISSWMDGGPTQGGGEAPTRRIGIVRPPGPAPDPPTEQWDTPVSPRRGGRPPPWTIVVAAAVVVVGLIAAVTLWPRTAEPGAAGPSAPVSPGALPTDPGAAGAAPPVAKGALLFEPALDGTGAGFIDSPGVTLNPLSSAIRHVPGALEMEALGQGAYVYVQLDVSGLRTYVADLEIAVRPGSAIEQCWSLRWAVPGRLSWYWCLDSGAETVEFRRYRDGAFEPISPPFPVHDLQSGRTVPVTIEVGASRLTMRVDDRLVADVTDDGVPVAGTKPGLELSSARGTGLVRIVGLRIWELPGGSS